MSTPSPRSLVALLALFSGACLAWSATCCPGLAWARESRGGTNVIKRARPPAAGWNKAAAKTFRDDAFSELDGERPDFAAAVKAASGGGGTAPGGGGATGGGGGGAGGFRWSALVSEETLTDEVKDMKAVLAAVIASQSDFKGGGYDKAREAFGAVGMCFGVIAAYDRDIRWKKDSETARDLFGRVSSNCKVGTDQSFNESKLRLADLEAMLEGGAPAGKPDREEDFRWSQVSGRPALMTRLEAADGVLAAGIASKGDFDKALDRMRHDAEIVATIGEVIQQADYEYFDDDTYRGYSSTMRDAALRIREAAAKKDYEAARSALGDLKKSCDACHGDYRS